MSTKTKRVIYYFCNDYSRPSWGTGLLHAHVNMLRKNGFQSAILFPDLPPALKWLDISVPAYHIQNPSLQFRDTDVLVVPEVFATHPSVARLPCRRIVFVQGPFLIEANLGSHADYQELGFERAITTLPHLKQIVESHYGVATDIIAPFIAPYFFQDPGVNPDVERKKQIVMFPKPGYKQVGYTDYQIVETLLERKCLSLSQWNTTTITDKTHREVASILQSSAISITVNCLEGFNTIVPESMAAGCIPVCYEAVGGVDVLQNNINAYVFPNNYVYPLLDKLFELMKNFDNLSNQLQIVRNNGFSTASRYTEAATEQGLINFYKKY